MGKNSKYIDPQVFSTSFLFFFFSLSISLFAKDLTFERFSAAGPAGAEYMAGDDLSAAAVGPLSLGPWEAAAFTGSLDQDPGATSGVQDENCVVQEEVKIRPNFCAEGGVELTAIGEYDSYSWSFNGQVLDGSTSRTILADEAGNYEVRVTDENGCTGKASIQTAEELVVNGDFNLGYEGFRTDYTYKELTGIAKTDKYLLWDEGSFGVGVNARKYHDHFRGVDHTTGTGNFLVVNGHPNQNRVIWQQTVRVRKNTRYYFSAWAQNLHSKNPARLQFTVNGVPTGKIAELSGEPVGEWIRFHTWDFWNSGEQTQAVIQIINLNTTKDGNDFGLDDISFGNLDPIPFSLSPEPQVSICEGEDVQLFANVERAWDGLKYSWRNPQGEIVSEEPNPVLENLSAEEAGTYTLRVEDYYGCIVQEGQTEVVVDLGCNALDFDGEDDHIFLGDNYGFGGEFTLEAWVKPHSLDGNRSLLSKEGKAGENTGYSLKIKNGKPAFRINDRELVSPHSIGNERWYHLAASFDGSQARLFIDGLEVASASMDLPQQTQNPFSMGASLDPDNPAALREVYHGWMEEVRLWKRALSAAQLRFMMNQRIAASGAGVRGAAIPMEVPGGLLWDELAGYYRLIATEAQAHSTEDLSTNSIPGDLRNMESLQENTAPLPYYTVQDGDWTDMSGSGGSPWAHPSVWNAPGGSGVGGEAVSWNIVRTSHNVTSGGENISILGLLSDEGTLVVSNPDGPQDETNSGIGLWVTHYLRLDGKIDLVGESHLIQSEGSILDENSKGLVERDQQGTASSFNYNYWSSPVSRRGSENNADYAVSEVLLDGTSTDMPQPLNFGHEHFFADEAYSGPKRISSYWLHKYTNSASGEYSEWKHVGETGRIKAGEGFTMKGTQGGAAITDPQNYTFRGKPHNGTISLSLTEGNDYLIGNPYPSALDADEFIKDNLEGRSGKNVFSGSLYFWDHFAGHTHILREYEGGYAVYNLSGGIVAVANDERINATGRSGDLRNIPRRYIPVGQAFYVSTSVSPEMEELTTISGGEITFNNSQRAFVPEGSLMDPRDVQSVFKSRETKEAPSTYQDERMKIYLRFESPTGYQRQLLVTADPEASNEFDLGYDAPSIENITEDMYWYFDGAEFLIQGVPHLEREQELDLGIKVKEAGAFKISIDHLENIPGGKEIYIRDNTLGTYHDLREEPFTLNTKPGILNGRFSLVFRAQAASEDTSGEDLQTDNPENGTAVEEHSDAQQNSLDGSLEQEGNEPEEPQIMYIQSSREIIIRNPDLLDIEGFRILNPLGQELQTRVNLPQDQEVHIPIREFSPGIFIVELQSEGRKYQEVIIINQ